MAKASAQAAQSSGGREATASPSRADEHVGAPADAGAENSQQDHDGLTASAWHRAKIFYLENVGLFFVFVAQIFATIMSMTTRLLQTGFETKFHALQVIFVRMIITASISCLYLWWKQVPDFLLGPPGVRRLLVLRGLCGTFGLFSLYYSLSFLEVADATVITFLVPTLTGFVCWIALNEPFTVTEALAGVVAFTGVLFIARPSFIVSHLPFGRDDPIDSPSYNGTADIAGGGIFDPVPITPAERSFAVVCSVIGSFFAAAAYATIRVIGKRVHSLVNVNYFSISATVISFLVLLIYPSIGFKMPQSTLQWTLLLSTGLAGFLMQLLLTEGLQRERAGRATNMIYTQLVSALVIDRVVWGTTPPLESLVGSALIVGAAVCVGLQKKQPVSTKKDKVPDEETSLLGREDD